MKGTLLASGLAALSLTGSAFGDFLVADFEGPTYNLGNVVGQDGWSNNGSAPGGSVITTSSSGLYTGGQAVAGHTYMGAKAIPTGNTQIQFDVFYHTGTATNERATVGFWNNADNNESFAGGELALSGGLVTGSPGPSEFGFRASGFGAELRSGVDAVANTWYRILLTFDDANTAASMEVINLTAGGTAVDLNGAAPGTAFSVDVDATQYGVLSTAAAGIAIRTSGNYAIDNIYSVGPVVPEPASLALLSLGGLAMMARRRHA